MTQDEIKEIGEANAVCALDSWPESDHATAWRHFSSYENNAVEEAGADVVFAYWAWIEKHAPELFKKALPW